MYAVKKLAKDWILPLVGAVITAVIINKLILFLILVPSGSMYPKIYPKDRIITTRIYNVDNIKSGDILVFYSDELQETMVKRVIGLPNDFVEIKEGGSVYINEKKIDESYVKYTSNRTGKYKVPYGKYLFLGDNRAHSFDSRSWKEPFISVKDIKGKAFFILYPFNRVSMLK